MRAHGPRLLVRFVEGPSQTGLIIHPISTGPPTFAVVVALGTATPDVMVGDMIVVKPYSGAAVEINQETLHFINYDDALAVLE